MKKINIFFSTLFLCLILSHVAFSQVNLDSIRSILPNMLGASNEGTEFVLSFHPIFENVKSTVNFTIFVTSNVMTEVRITIPFFKKEPIFVKNTIPNSVIQFNLSADTALPYRKLDTAHTKPSKVWQGRGIIIESDDPITVFILGRSKDNSMIPQNKAEGTLILPLTCLGKEYRVSSYAGTTDSAAYVSIVGAYDNTQVSIDIGGNNILNVNYNGEVFKSADKISVNINKGDSWLIAAEGYGSNLAGSKIVSDKPISVISGNYCTVLPGEYWGNYLIEQEIPTCSWGKKYFISPINNQTKPSRLRFLSNVANTVILNKENISNTFTLDKDYGVDGEGWFEKSSYIHDPADISGSVYLSDSTFNVIQFNTSNPNSVTDPPSPFQMMVLSNNLFKNNFQVILPMDNSGLIFKNNYINILFRDNISDDIPDDIEISYKSQNQEITEKIKSMNYFNYMKYDYPPMPGYDSTYSVSIKLDRSGIYNIKSPVRKIMVYSYGFYSGVYSKAGDNHYTNDAYGSASGGIFKDLSRKDTIIPRPYINYNNNTSLENGYVTDTDNEGNGNLALILLHKAYSNNVKLTYNNFIPGETKKCNFSVSMIDTTQEGYALITFSDRSGNDSTIYLHLNPLKNISIINPVLNQKFKPKDTIKIEWSSNFQEKVKIELQKDDQLTLIISDSSDNNGQFSFLVPESLQSGKNYKIKISSLADSSIYSISDSFEIFVEIVIDSITSVTVYGTRFKYGDILPIKWTCNFDSNIMIDLYENGIWSLSINNNTSNNRSHNWEIPLTLLPSKFYSVLISEVAKPDVKLMSDKFEIYDPNSININYISDDFFIIYPNPTNENLMIEMKNHEYIIGLTLLDINCELVCKIQNICKQTFSLNLSNLLIGKYVLLIQTDRRYFSTSLIIKR